MTLNKQDRITDFCVLTLYNTVSQRFSGVLREFGETSENVRKSLAIKISSTPMIKIICKNNTMIRILAVELSDTTLLLP
jgi:hypothetical protein